MKAYFNAEDLAYYTSQSFEKKFKEKISSIKLQKSLYFLFAYWGGFVKKSNQASKDDRESFEVKDYRPYLFDNTIEAWIYGPVVPSVFKSFDLNNKEQAQKACVKINGFPFVKAFIDDLLNDLFRVSDFKLVDLSHQDKSWKDQFCYLESFHNHEIKKEDILDEYSKRI
ncbi:MAG: DUF4065 domain-containing protein [Clostridia bacterium]|nr:DUF4065 domain-containing protein [Clostridia bacterium]